MSLEVGQTNGRGGRFPAMGTAAGPGMADLDSPLVGDAAGLRASWQRIQAGFVDDPRESVADAAALVEHAAQVLVGTLRQRQQQLRGMWDTTVTQGAAGTGDAGPGDAGTTADAGTAADGTRATDAPRAADRALPTFTPATTPMPRTADDDATGRGGTAGGSATADDDATTDSDATTDGDVRMADSGATTAGNDAADGVRTADSGVTDGARTAGNDPADSVGTADSGVTTAGARSADSGAGAGGGQAGGYPRIPDPRDAAFRGGGAPGGGRPAAGGGADTEQLRVLMQRYRSLLNQICPPL